MKSNILADPVLVERDRQLEQLQQFLDSAKEGKGTAVFVSGEAGAGKTRLISEFLSQAKKQSVTVLRGWCLSNAAVPYFPFFEAFNDYFTNEKQTQEIELRNWLLGPPKEKFGGPQIVSPQVWKDQTFTAVANTLAAISARQPVILFIDDLHWADSASLSLLHYLGQTVSDERVLLLATFRIEQLTVDSEGRPNPLMETLRLMKRQDLVKEISVLSLDQTGVRELANNMLGGAVKEVLVNKLTEESQGNPLFVVESLRMLDEKNELTLDGDKWGLTSGSIGIPPKIKDIILQRLGTLVRCQRDILDVASIIGEKFDPTLLSSVLNQDTVDVIKVLDLIGKETSIVRCEGELYRFDHARTRDAIYGDISSALKRVYHSKVAQLLESTCGDGAMRLTDLAYHYLRSGNKDKAVKYALAAGQDALAKWSNTEAVEKFTFVLQAIGNKPEQSQRIIALEGLGDAYYASNNFKQAIVTYEQMADSQINGASKLRALRKALHASFYQGDLDWFMKLFAKTDNLAAADRLEAARILYLKANIYAARNDWLTTKKIDLEALRIFEEEYALDDTANVLLWVGFGSATLGDLENGIAHALRSIAIYDELDDFRSEMEAYAYAGGTFQACALSEESNNMLAKAIETNEKYKIWDYVRLFPAYVWQSLSLIGVDVAGSISKAHQALEYFKRTDSLLYAGAVHGVLIVGYALAGDTARVNEYYQGFKSLPPAIQNNAPSQIYFAPVMGVYFAANNDFENSTKCFTEWQAAAKSTFPNPFLEASTKQLYGWALAKEGKMVEAQNQIAEAQKIIQEINERFTHVNIISSLLTQARPLAEREFTLRIDAVNVSRSEGFVLGIERFPAELEIIDVSDNCIFHNGQVEFKEKRLGAFEVKTAKLTVKAASGAFTLEPQITYLNEAKETKISRPRPITITVQLTPQNRNYQSQSPSEDPSEIDILKKFGLTK